MKKNLTIAFFTDSLHNTLAQRIWRGLSDVTREHGAGLLNFTGDYIADNNPANVVYDLVPPGRVDGIVMYAGLLGYALSPEAKRQFWGRYLPTPTVLLEEVEPGFPCMTVDFRNNMRIVVTHLIETHGYRRIAFIRGMATHAVAEMFYQGYQDALAAHDIPCDPALVTPLCPTPDFRSYGRRGIQLLFDERQVKPEAVVGFNDITALGAMEALQARGLRVPEDVAVAGHDDMDETPWSLPSLTTIPNPAYEMGRQSAEILLAKIAGETVPETTVITARVIVRQSCGCLHPEVARAGAELPVAADDLSGTEAGTAHRAAIVDAMTQAVGDGPHAEEQAGRLFDAFAAALNDDQAQGAFLGALQAVLRQVMTTGGQITVWQNALSELRRHVRPSLNTDAMVLQAETLWQQARALTGAIAQQVQGHRGFQGQQQMAQLRKLETMLIATFDVQALMDILAEQLPKLGISTAYIALYVDPAHPTAEARLIMAYTAQGRIPLESPGCVYPARDLLPSHLFPGEKPGNLVVEPLFFQEQQIGFAIFETRLKTADMYDDMYEAVRVEISSALQGALLVQQVQTQMSDLNAAYEEIRVLNEQLKDENIRMSAEMALARRIQTSLLPQTVKGLHPDFDIAAIMLPAEEVGGDYYDITLDREGSLWFGIGDVSGHGVTPGLIMMMAQTAHTTIASSLNASPRDVVTIINQVLYKNVHGRLHEGHFMTFTVLKYLGDGRFQHAGAHLDLIVYRQRTGACERIKTQGTWLNFIPDISHATEDSVFTLEIGDILVLYTDGVTEIWNSQKEMLDIHGFMNIVTTHAGKDAQSLQDAIIADVMNWCNQTRNDDMSLVVVRRMK